MSKSTAKDLKKIYSMNKPSIIKLIRGVNSESSRAAGYLGDVNSYIFDCAEPWIEKGDIDVIKEVLGEILELLHGQMNLIMKLFSEI